MTKIEHIKQEFTAGNAEIKTIGGLNRSHRLKRLADLAFKIDRSINQKELRRAKRWPE